MALGAFRLPAIGKTPKLSLTPFSDSPTHFDIRAGPWTEMNFT